MRYSLIFILLLVCCFQATCWGASSKDKARKQIHQLDQSIHTIKHKINQTQKHKQSLQDKLQKLDEQVANANKQLRKTQNKLDSVQKKLNHIHKQRDHYKQKLTQQRKHLSNIIQASYQLGQQPYIKLVLNQQDPQSINRYLHYASHLSEYQITWLHKIKNTLEALHKTKHQLAQKHEKLKKLQHQQHKHQSYLQKRKHKREKVIHQLDQALQKSHQRLQNIKANKEHLQQVLKRSTQNNQYSVKGKHFYQAKGKLAWPIESRHITQTYGEPQLDGRVKSSGIKIQAENGQPIHAIFHGQVVFAHWLRGYGLMAVVQHGSHYMTLYAHAQSLYVQKGDKVDPGDIIATVGQSGGLDHSALYFEIRHNGHAINPLSWLET